ncbi:MAG: hypothetical protein IJT04_01885 [Bacteroidales bacterium]|nr:hypothetical protein [Bacteroidales bacterium]
MFEGIENQDYFEIHVDSEGCESILNALGALQTNGNVIINAGMTVAKEGFQTIPNLILKFEPIEHFGDTNCNIWCRKQKQSIEMQLTTFGIEELHWIIENVLKSGDHYHFIGGFNLYVKDDNNDEIKAINLYFD